MNIKRIIGLNEEALLLDSPLYIAKSALAIATGYFIGKIMPIAHIDMISVLLGVMYNLEPFNTTGIKNGISQIVASTLGAACTTVLIVLFGINGITVSLSMALTLYVGLKLNWRMVSPVAIFTCIYMTQFVQSDVLGNPSPWLTFRVRIVALTVGVLVAIFYNYVFSFFYYRKIAYKRVEFAKRQVIKGLEFTVKHMCETPTIGRSFINVFPGIFDDLDLVYSNIELIKKETNHFFSVVEEHELEMVMETVKRLRDMNHLAYDMNYYMFREADLSGKDFSIYTHELESVIQRLSRIDFIAKGKDSKRRRKQGERSDELGTVTIGANRLEKDLAGIKENIYRIEEINSML